LICSQTVTKVDLNCGVKIRKAHLGVSKDTRAPCGKNANPHDRLFDEKAITPDAI
jgi:hypothetical protein